MFSTNIPGQRKRGRPRIRWKDAIQRDLENFRTESERHDGQGDERKNKWNDEEEAIAIGPCLTSGLVSSMMTIYLQYLRMQHMLCVTKINTSMDTESLFVILFIVCIYQVGPRNRHIIGHLASEGPIHSI